MSKISKQMDKKQKHTSSHTRIFLSIFARHVPSNVQRSEKLHYS